MMNKFVGTLFLFFGIILILGGGIGYIKSSSIISLLSGGFFGLIIIISSIGIFQKKIFFSYLAFSSTLFIDLVFFIRYWKTEAFFPGAMSLLTSIILLTAYYSARKQTVNIK